MTTANKASAQKTTEDADTEVIACGIIMPISATSSFSDKHWSNVQVLLHRAVKLAGMNPVNVWTGEPTDRISERIVGNIFSHEIVIADISDLNPNVMLELGLRLASKKPTIVVVNNSGSIPFDIRDFHVIHYPSDLNIIDMEEFLTNLSLSLKTKIESSRSGTYSPFLGHVVVDVLSPETRQVSLSDLVVDRLDEISKRIGRLEHSGRSPQSPSPTSRTISEADYRGSRSYYEAPADTLSSSMEILSKFYNNVETIGSVGESIYFSASNPASKSPNLSENATKALEKIGGSRGIPERHLKLFQS